MAREKNKKKNLNKDMKVFYIVAALVLIGIVALIATLLSPGSEVKKVATIKDNVISGLEFRYYYTQQVNTALINNNVSAENAQDFLNSGSGDSTIGEALKKYTFDQTVLFELLQVKANEEGYTVDKSELEGEWKAFKESVDQVAEKNGVSKRDFARIYFGVSYNKVKDIYKDGLFSQKYLQKKMAEIEIDEEKLSEFYKNNYKYFDKAKVRHILIEVPDAATEAEKTEKKQLAEDILEKVNAGEDFAALVKECSADDGSLETGGFYEVSYNQMVQEFEEWVFAHESGDTGIVETDYGYHIMKHEGLSATLEAHREQIEEAYRYETYTKDLVKLLDTDEYKLTMVSGYGSF
ncbi:MAG: peptidylprolyl isomerase [Eubacteriales bacterium]|nr:peptidylprolyl isomerase [Eubacteriales bacterium]